MSEQEQMYRKEMYAMVLYSMDKCVGQSMLPEASCLRNAVPALSALFPRRYKCDLPPVALLMHYITINDINKELYDAFVATMRHYELIPPPLMEANVSQVLAALTLAESPQLHIIAGILGLAWEAFPAELIARNRCNIVQSIYEKRNDTEIMSLILSVLGKKK